MKTAVSSQSRFDDTHVRAVCVCVCVCEGQNGSSKRPAGSSVKILLFLVSAETQENHGCDMMVDPVIESNIPSVCVFVRLSVYVCGLKTVRRWGCYL